MVWIQIAAGVFEGMENGCALIIHLNIIRPKWLTKWKQRLWFTRQQDAKEVMPPSYSVAISTRLEVKTSPQEERQAVIQLGIVAKLWNYNVT